MFPLPALSQASLTRRLGLAAAIGTALGAGSLGLLWHRLLRRPLPKLKGTLMLDGLNGPVEIARDRWGVPHIEAGHRHDLWFGQGFSVGQDRLWQLDFYRRITSGRLAEMAGAGGLPADRLMLTLGLRRLAEREEGELAPSLRDALEAFCAGLNAAASERPLPFEFQVLRLGFDPWRPADMLAITKLLAFGLSTNWERELLRADMVRELGPKLTARLEPTYPVANPVVLQEPWSGDGLAMVEQIDRVRAGIGLAVEAGGSNNWAVSGSRSATGTPLLAGDPHLSPSMPGVWYHVALRHGERILRGASLPAVPGIFMGQGTDVAWTLTNVMADVQDLFIERVDGDRYLFEDEWRPLEVVREEIPVKGRSEPDVLEVRHTHHGPIVNEALGADAGEPLALSWTALEGACVQPSMVNSLDVTSGEELIDLVSDHFAPASNLVWADRHGSIGYKLIGALPQRRGDTPDLPKPGWTGEFEWEGTVPYEELPELVDPESGFIVTANNRIVGDDYPHHITSEWLDGFRARRVEALLRTRHFHDLDGFAEMQTDHHSIPGAEVAWRLARLEPRDQRESAALERLRSWNGRMDPDSVAASIYQAFLLRLAREFARVTIRDRDLSERYLDRADNGFISHSTSPWRWHARLLELWEEGDPALVGRPWDEFALDALRGALDDLSARFGPDLDGWRWGRVHEMEFPHALGGANPLFTRLLNRRMKVGGAQETISQIAYDPNDPFRAVWAPSWRMVADVADPDHSRWQMFTGQSGHPASPHYDDLQQRWLDGLMQPMAGEGPWRRLRLEPADGAAFHAREVAGRDGDPRKYDHPR